MIADSNLRPARDVPDHWEVHVFPGAKCLDVLRLLQGLVLPSDARLHHVFIHVDINYREDEPRGSDISEVIEACRRRASQYAFVEVSAALSMSRKEREGIFRFNRMVRERTRHIIRAIPADEVTIERGDKYGIHHDAHTVQKIIQSIIRYEETVMQPSSRMQQNRRDRD